MSHDLEAKIVRFGICVLVMFLLVIGYVFYQSYQGRADLVQSQRFGCERGKKDRNANARGWRIAEKARVAEGELDVAEQYRKIAAGLERRGRIDCVKAFPKAGLLP
jgi:hypothetical protein